MSSIQLICRTVAAVFAFAALSAALAAGRADPASTAAAVASACDSPQHHQFDYWVGDWQVFDATNNNLLVAVDHIEKEAAGCIIQQNLTFITNKYRRDGVGYRLAGIGVNRYDGERWLQLWADNQWGAIALQGAPDEHGSMVFTSIIASRGRDLKLIYEKRADGSVRNLEYVAPTGTQKWEKYGDLIYRRNR